MRCGILTARLLLPVGLEDEDEDKGEAAAGAIMVVDDRMPGERYYSRCLLIVLVLLGGSKR